jgi:hypothetical protein
LAKLEKLHSFLETDRASDFRGLKGTTKRIELDVPPRNNIEALNDCVARAKRHGQYVHQPEPGVTYLAVYGKPDYEAISSKGIGRANAVFFLNSSNNDHVWAPYIPFITTIRDEGHLLDFIEGRLFLIVLIDTQVLCDLMSSDGWAVRYRPDHEYAIHCLHCPTKAYFAVSAQLLARAAYEFASLAWIVDACRPSLERLEYAAGENFGPSDPSAQSRRVPLEFFGPDAE